MGYVVDKSVIVGNATLIVSEKAPTNTNENNIFDKTNDSPISNQKNKQDKTDQISLVLKSIKVKKSAKKLVLQATLKQGKKALSGKKITFKFNGKKYNAKTNKKGIAKVIIKKKVLKKLKVGKMVKYQAYYGKIVAKKTAKIRKQFLRQLLNFFFSLLIFLLLVFAS